MRGITYRIDFPELDAEALSAAVQKHLVKSLKVATKEFLVTAVSNIPVYTGFASGSLRNIDDLVGRVKRRRPVAPKRMYYKYPGGKVLKTTQSGRRFSNKDIFDKGRARLAKGQTSLFFKFRVDITYFTILDRQRWGSFELGNTAFDASIKSSLKKMPKTSKFVKRRTLK